MKKFTIRNQGEIKAQFPAESIDEQEALNAIHKFWGFPERPEIGEDGEPTGVMLPADYTIEVEDITAQHQLSQIIASRRAEYPTAEEFLNAFFDGGQSALDDLQALRLAVKAKYPKP
jgi:hypothetical protein